MTSPQAVETPNYPFTEDACEKERLAVQQMLYAPFFQELIKISGCHGDIRLLDLACGFGDLTEIALDYLGTDAKVVGVDHSDYAISVAKKRFAHDRRVKFVTSDACRYMQAIDSSERFDVVISRLFMMYTSKPQFVLETVRHCALHPSGLMILQEAVHTNYGLLHPNEQNGEFHRQAHEFIRKTCQYYNVHFSYGSRLAHDVHQAGFMIEGSHTVGRMDGGDANPISKLIAKTILGMKRKVDADRKGGALFPDLLANLDWIPECETTVSKMLMSGVDGHNVAIGSSTLVGVIARARTAQANRA